MFEALTVEAILTAEGWIWHLNDEPTGETLSRSIGTFPTAEDAHKDGERNRQIIIEQRNAT